MVSGDLIIAAVGAAGGAFGTLFTNVYKNNQYRLEKEKWLNDARTEKEHESDWVKDVNNISVLSNTRIREREILKVRRALGALPGTYEKTGCDKSYDKNLTTNVGKSGFKIRRPRMTWFDKMVAHFSDKPVEALRYHNEFKNAAFLYVDEMHQIILTKKVLTEEQAEGIRAICRELRQDRWDTDKINDREAELSSKYKVFSIYGSRPTLVALLSLIISLVGGYTMYIIPIDFIVKNKIIHIIIAVILFIVIFISALIRYGGYWRKRNKLNELKQKRTAQRLKTVKIIKKLAH